MRTLLSERFAPTTSAIGFLELSLERAVDSLAEWRRSLHPQVRVTQVEGDLSTTIPHLEPLTGGIIPRELLVPMGDRWTAYFNNSLRGTEAVGPIGHLSRVVPCQGVAVRCVPHTMSRANPSGRMGAVQFELFGPLSTDFINYVRTVSATHDGSRWRFDANGTVQDFEDVDRYERRTIRDRFDSEMLERYCQALGIDVFEPDSYRPGATLIESAVPVPSNAKVMTIAEVQQWLGIRPGEADDLPG